MFFRSRVCEKVRETISEKSNGLETFLQNMYLTKRVAQKKKGNDLTGTPGFRRGQASLEFGLCSMVWHTGEITTLACLA